VAHLSVRMEEQMKPKIIARLKVIVKPRMIAALLAAATILAPTTLHAHSAMMLPVGQVQAGEDAMQRGQWSEAASDFRRAIDTNYHDAMAHSKLGSVYLHTGETARAADEFKVALRLHPHLSSAENGLHQTFASEGDHDGYLTLFRDEIQKDPGNADAHTSLAEELLDHNQSDEALKEAQAALRLKPDLGHARCVLGRIEAERGQEAAARQDLNLAVKRDRNDDDAWGALGDLALKTNDGKEALACFRRAAAAAPEHAEWHEKLAAVLAASGDAAAAGRETTLAAQLSAPLPHNGPHP